jgi:hypothetical protein
LSSDERSIAQALDRLGYTSKAAQQQALLQIKTAGLVEVAAFKKARKTREDSPQGLRTSDGEPRSVGWWDVEDGQNG